MELMIPVLKYIKALSVALGLLMPAITAAQDRIEQGTFPFSRSMDSETGNQARAQSNMRNWIVKKFGPGNVEAAGNKFTAYGSFTVVSRNFLGKTTRTCLYTYTLVQKGDSLQASISDIYLTWYKAPMHKSDVAGNQYRSLSEILPLNKKVPLEKKAYRQYLAQMEAGFEKLFAETRKATEITSQSP